jgi:D-arabinose 1-dehydrogenase-like Zn-dependent alcohol dehydrogenase
VKAVVYDGFGATPELRDVADPVPAPHGVVVRVEATGLCRSDWHGWMGHDADIRVMPHVPGHELAGVVESIGAAVTRWQPGDRVTVPFVCACGTCPQCASGNHQVCDRQSQPGFTHWGSFAELVALDQADINLVRLPDSMDFVTAASLGCRFATAWRAVVAQGRVKPGEWVAVYGCGGVGLSAVMIAVAAGAKVVAIDVAEAALATALNFGARHAISAQDDVAAAVRDATSGGAHLSIDALGSPATCVASIESLRKRGRHVQVGLIPEARGYPAVPMDRVIAYELEILGSHGMQAHEYPAMLAAIESGRLEPGRLVSRCISLAEAGEALVAMETYGGAGVTVIVPARSATRASSPATRQV